MYPKHYFSLMLVLYRVGGVYDPDEAEGAFSRGFFRVYNKFVFVLCPVYYSAMEMGMMYYTSSNLYEFIDHVGMILVHVVGSLKMMLLLRKREMIKRLTKLVKDPRFHYEDYGCEFQPGNIVKTHYEVTERICTVFTLLGTMVPLSNQFKAANEFVAKRHMLASANVTCGKLLPYYCLFPFATDTISSCIAAFLLQSLPMILYVYVIGAFDLSFVYLATYLRGHFLCIRGAFGSLRERCLLRLGLPPNYETFADSENPELEREIQKELAKITKHLLVIIRIFEDFKSFCSIPLLFQSLSALGIYISCLYIISLEPLLSAEAYARIQYAIGVLFQFSLYCFYGSEVTFAARSVTEGIYGVKWYSSSKSVKTTLIIHLMRMQKSLEFTVGRFAPLNLTTYIQVLKGSYSFYTFLTKK